MLIIDSQIHPYGPGANLAPGGSHLPGPPSATGEEILAAMAAAGVDAAILVSAWAYYRYDARYAVSVRNQWPERFALVNPVDLDDPALAETVAAWGATPGAIAIRLLLPSTTRLDPDDARLHTAILAAKRAGLAINMACVDQMPLAGHLASRHPSARFVLDHLGLRQPLEPPPLAEPFADLANVLALAAHDNIAIKVSGVGTLSRQAWPFADIWPPLARVFAAYGLARCMWGSDWTRTIHFLSYAQAVAMFRDHAGLAGEELAQLMGGTLQRIYGWTPAIAAPPPARAMG
ncbi:amidohydrolase family protein [Novosphingobium bradum]|uniref:Amidohydrolase family protein n=1 Tax=Novosphingobium bradum TaxID=1737444 RepID=A0ABV7INY2_9SPHN